jgi:hypothetical protein
MNFVSKALIGSAAAGAMAVSTPALARDRYDDDDGISAGEIIAGAVVLGGLAAILGSSNRDRYDRDYRYDRRDYRYGDRYDRRGYGYNNANSARAAVEQCVRAAERQAQRYTGRDAEVYEIRDVDRERRGYEIKGRIAVQDGYGYGRRNDYRRNYRNSGWDEGSFTCDVRNGRVVDLDFKGIRSL